MENWWIKIGKYTESIFETNTRWSNKIENVLWQCTIHTYSHTNTRTYMNVIPCQCARLINVCVRYCWPYLGNRSDKQLGRADADVDNARFLYQRVLVSERSTNYPCHRKPQRLGPSKRVRNGILTTFTCWLVIKIAQHIAPTEKKV